VQQAWPVPPHVPQLPLAQVPPIPGHVLPEAVQVLVTQQPPPVQVSPAQQASPAAPQAEQTPAPFPVHTNPVEHARPAQHASPPAPHAAHTPAPLQIAPALQVLPPQHAWPAAPHAPASPPLLLPLLLPEEPPLLLLLSEDASLPPDEDPLEPPEEPPLLPPEEPPLLLPPPSSVEASEPEPPVVVPPPHARINPRATAVTTRIDIFMCKLPLMDNPRLRVPVRTARKLLQPSLQRLAEWLRGGPNSLVKRLHRHRPRRTSDPWPDTVVPSPAA